MNLLSAENLSKSYGDKTLFEGLSFGLAKGEKTALIANNGTGKSTLLKILSGTEQQDTGNVTLRDGLKVAFLDQDPRFETGISIEELITSSHGKISQIIQNYEKAVDAQSKLHNSETEKRLETAMAEMDHHKAWDYNRRLKQLLSLFRIDDTSRHTDVLSGGEKKRLALALVLLDEPELLILDEPTNHLDVEMIEWLEAYLSRSNLTLLMVTHDRYFLDRVCNHIMEMSQGQLYYHNGNYEYFLQKKAEREEVVQVETDKARQLMKKELEWLRRQPKARTTKSKSRIQAFDGIKEKATGLRKEQDLKLQVNVRRIGGKILEIENLSKSYGDIKIVEDFSYLFKRGERIGIIGKNGSGKTSFLNLITGNESPDHGKVVTGQTIVFGYYRQAGIPVSEDKTIIEVVKDIAEIVPMGDGNSISASKFLEHFMFPPEVQYKQVSLLSGGEKRRLNLLMVLIKNPNFLILDEPTNDLDLLILNRLEEFLMNFGGCLILVSHDRYFLDKLTDHLFIFEGDGKVRDHYGSYSKYRIESEQRKQANKEPVESRPKAARPRVKTRLSFNEKREYESLEKEIEELEKEKAEVEATINSGIQDYEELNRLSARIGELINLIDEKTLRWMELDELVGD
jgi:ATP-binding cassette subfamily F protein uup